MLNCGKRGVVMRFSNGWSVTMTKVGTTKDVRYFGQSRAGNYHVFADGSSYKTTASMDEIAAFTSRIANGGGREGVYDRNVKSSGDDWVPPEPVKERKAYPPGHCGCDPCEVCDEDYGPIEHDVYDYYKEEEEEPF